MDVYYLVDDCAAAAAAQVKALLSAAKDVDAIFQLACCSS
jgi:hypothetical protein